MWRGHQALQSSAQRWLLRGRHHLSAGNQHHTFSFARCHGGAVSYAAANKLLIQKPSLLPAGVDLPSLKRYRLNPSLISCHDFSTERPRVPRFDNFHSVEEVIVTAYEYLDFMSRRDVSAFWTCILKMISKRQPRQKLTFDDTEHILYEIFDNTTHEDNIMDCGMRELTETTLGMAKIVKIFNEQGKRRGESSTHRVLRRLLLSGDTAPNRELFRFLATASVDILDEFDARSLSNLALAYAKIDYVPDFDDGSDLFDSIAMQAVHIKEDFNAQDISNMVWAYATVNKPHDLLFEAIGDQVVGFKQLDEFDPQALKDIVWAYATAGVSHTTLFEKVANHIVKSGDLDQFKPQHLSNTVWAYATAGIYHPKLFEAMGDQVVAFKQLKEFKPQELSNTVLAYAKAGVNHPKLFETVANHILESDSLHRFRHPQDFSNTVWAYATAGINHSKLFDKVANHIVQSDILNRFNQQALSNTVWAYATAQVSHPKLFQKVANAAIRRQEEFISQEVANLLWAYATMGIIDKQLFSSFVPTAAKLIDTFNNQDLSHIAWAYAVADRDAPSLFNKGFINKCGEKKDGFVVENFSQLYQWHLWQTKEKCNPGLPEEFSDRCHEAFISEDPTISKLQQDVVAQLSSFNLEPKEEVLMDSGYRIDAIVGVNGKTVGVEVDGPFHFIGKSRSPIGSTILKRRQVPSIDGIELVSVPYWEWNKLGKNKTKKQDYLRRLLRLKSDNE